MDATLRIKGQCTGEGSVGPQPVDSVIFYVVISVRVKGPSKGDGSSNASSIEETRSIQLCHILYVFDHMVPKYNIFLVT